MPAYLRTPYIATFSVRSAFCSGSKLTERCFGSTAKQQQQQRKEKKIAINTQDNLKKIRYFRRLT